MDVAADSVPEGGMLGMRVDGEAVVLARVEGRLHAVEGVCPHAFALLEEGELEGHRLRCPRHWAAFDVRTGANVEPPTCPALAVYPVEVVDGRVRIGPPRR